MFPAITGRARERTHFLADLDRLVADALRADAEGNTIEAEDKFLNAVAGFKSLLSPMAHRTARAAYLLTAFYANHQQMDQVDKVLSWLTSVIIERWGLRHQKTLSHFLRIVELLRSWNRHEHARVIIYKLLDNWHEIEDGEPFDIPSSNPGVIMEASGNLGDVQDSIFEESSDASQVDVQLHVANLWLSSGVDGMDIILPRLISQCEKYPKELLVQTIQARCSLTQLHITEGQHGEARSVLQLAWSSLEKHLEKQHNMTKPLLHIFRRLVFLCFQIKDKRACEEILERAAYAVEFLVSIPPTGDSVDIAIQFLISIGAEYQERSSWQRTRPWFERALALSIRALGPSAEMVAKLERTLKEKRYQLTRLDINGDDVTFVIK